MPTVDTKAWVKLLSQYRNKNEVFPTLEFPDWKSKLDLGRIMIVLKLQMVKKTLKNFPHITYNQQFKHIIEGLLAGIHGDAVLTRKNTTMAGLVKDR